MKRYLLVILVSLLSVHVFAQQPVTSQPASLVMGSKAPDFNGVDYQGKKHNLKSLLKGHSAVVIFFYRGQWCQYCNKYLKLMQDNLAKLTAKGAAVVAVTPEVDLAINTTASKTGAGFPIMNDKGYKIMKAYKVDYVVSATDLALMRKYHIDIDANNGNADHVLPIPATYVINKKEKIVFAHFDVDYRKRAAMDDIIAAIPAM
ncbi:AhpC/TSA family protein [Mucilaginibacter sp. HMF5004]|uniref:peroxiredoxin-like family protein n=1 Tax=Mucilaginibacter rivuli TaxID=2857527 RepID=UPI001C5DC5A7|nr:peroxiredoxin-like family protein [Mucilaginibacter rivuli]MBW4889416.1 AhpC/TSA family protein [Mucilaginibacter rivuli]